MPSLRRDIADGIAEKLFRDGQGSKADRLVLTVNGSSRDLGGWCRKAVSDLIYNHLPIGGRLTQRDPGVLQRAAIEDVIAKVELAVEIWDTSGQPTANLLRRQLGDLRLLCLSSPPQQEEES